MHSIRCRQKSFLGTGDPRAVFLADWEAREARGSCLKSEGAMGKKLGRMFLSELGSKGRWKEMNRSLARNFILMISC